MPTSLIIAQYTRLILLDINTTGVKLQTEYMLVFINMIKDQLTYYGYTRWVPTALSRITVQAFISFQRILTRALSDTDVYYRKKHILLIICDASDEF